MNSGEHPKKPVGVLGSGDVGRTLGAGFLKHGHQVMLGTRDPKKAEVQTWVRATQGAKAGTFAETVRFGELVVLAALGRAVESIMNSPALRIWTAKS